VDEGAMRVHTIATRTHGRYLVDVPDGDVPAPLLVGFHGYAERAEDMLEVLQRIRGDRSWLLVSVQALNRFYTRSQEVVANWMTREDRELAIHDNVEYVAEVVAAVRQAHATTGTIVYAGFSQGVAMAYRAAAFAAERSVAVPAAAGGIMLAGDVPPDVAPRASSLPPLLIGRGIDDRWYSEEKSALDVVLLECAGVRARVHVFPGGHVWHESFVAAAARFLDSL
jgi:predicted esterase